jgi:hypothetical protein
VVIFDLCIHIMVSLKIVVADAVCNPAFAHKGERHRGKNVSQAEMWNIWGSHPRAEGLDHRY